jgi:hypothetical protein
LAATRCKATIVAKPIIIVGFFIVDISLVLGSEYEFM